MADSILSHWILGKYNNYSPVLVLTLYLDVGISFLLSGTICMDITAWTFQVYELFINLLSSHLSIYVSHKLIPQDIWTAYREDSVNSVLELGKVIPLWYAFGRSCQTTQWRSERFYAAVFLWWYQMPTRKLKHLVAWIKIFSFQQIPVAWTDIVSVKSLSLFV